MSTQRTTTVIVGAGHAGLAMSRNLTQRSIDHVVFERGEVANTWRTERWDSLRLLTPNWQSRLPDYSYDGADPDGFRTMRETVDYIARYAELSSAPVETRTRVGAVRARGEGYEVETSRGVWQCRSVVIASGACNRASVPDFADALPAGIDSYTPLTYRNPEQLQAGGVLVVGASASGTQIAREIQASGRQVTLSAGEHIRVPRTYRGRDIKWWMDATGVLDERYDEVDDIERARRVPSLQLAGSPQGYAVDLNALTDCGVALVGRTAGLRANAMQFSGSLRNHCAMSDLKMNRLLNNIDTWATEYGLDSGIDAPQRFEPTRVADDPPLALDLKRGAIRSVIWATGLRPDYHWLQVPVFDRKGRLRHNGGIVEAPGLYVMGLPFMRRRKSTLIDGAADDARDLSYHLAAWLAGDSAARFLSLAS